MFDAVSLMKKVIVSCLWALGCIGLGGMQGVLASPAQKSPPTSNPPSLFASRADGVKVMKKLTTQGFIMGTKGPILTAFVSPECIYCIELYKGLKPLADQGKVRVRFIMVGPGEELPAALAINSSKDPLSAMDKYYANLIKGEDAPIQGVSPTPEAIMLMGSNEALAAGGNKEYATPMVLACPTKTTTKWIVGLPNFAMLKKGIETWPKNHTPCDLT